MKIIITKNYEELSARATEIMLGVVKQNPKAVLGLATGTTPLGLYAKMIADHRENGMDYSQIRTVNLDEYKGLPKTHEQSYAYFMRKNLFEGLGIAPEQTNIENGTAKDEKAECLRYDALLEEEPRDIQLLGLGSNGHIAFNEPGTPRYACGDACGEHGEGQRAVVRGHQRSAAEGVHDGDKANHAGEEDTYPCERGEQGGRGVQDGKGGSE